MDFKSEIRESTINELLEKVTKDNFGKYLKKLTLNPTRGFKDETIKFEFPVTAIIGPNGGGKTTVLGAAACAYKEVKPSRFFTKSGKYDSNMQDWKIEFEIIDKKIKPNDIIKRTASFKNFKWSREALSRDITIFGVSRTVPASERKELRKCASNTFQVPEEQISNLTQSVIVAVEKILGKDISNYTLIKVDKRGKVTLLTGRTEDGISFTEFHFGAGESSIIRMVSEIETLPENSLVLIEEIENGLHPIATIRIVEYLIDLAQRKKIQSIFTTHSNDALLPLPNQAIWSAINYRLVQGKLDIKSLRAITGQVDARLAIFVEDMFAKKWLESIINNDSKLNAEEIEVHGMEGDGTAVSINKHHNADPTFKFPSICFIDGDSKQKENDEEKIYRLPGQSPETYIYDKILDVLDSVIGELTVSLHKRFEEQDFVKSKIKETRKTNRDEHLLFVQLGKAIGFVSEEVVRSAFLTIWNRQFHAEASQLRQKIEINLTD